jgi:hypothetical protein
MRRSDLAALFFGPPSQPYPWATDCQIKFDTWLELAKLGPGGRPNRAKLIISVDEEFGVRDVMEDLLEAELRLEDNVLASGSFIAANLNFDEVVGAVLPLTALATLANEAHQIGNLERFTHAAGVTEAIENRIGIQGNSARRHENADQLSWFVGLLLAVEKEVLPKSERANPNLTATRVGHLLDIASQPRWLMTERVTARHPRFPITTVTPNRAAMGAVSRSRTTIKADAAERVFSVDCSDIGWAVLDGGIDALHPAFQEWGAGGVASATRIRRIFNFVDLQRALKDNTRSNVIDWKDALSSIEIEVPRGSRSRRTPKARYERPTNPHGTHVAGVLGANWPAQDLFGVCPTIRLYDFRVLDDAGGGDEFAIIAAMQAIRHINEESGRMVIAGANLSLSVSHEVSMDSCGWTPVCIEAERLVRSGVVVVAAAGNSGYAGPTSGTTGGDYRPVSISDPGNAEAVITVGSTHPSHPHRHGVSYFSGRGPTADGRAKPDIIAPGERIEGPVPGDQIATMYGTSQAAPHVSGAAAMLMARNRELLGRPERVKDILCSTATDLGRERAFQGSGLVDILRALQSV